MTKQCPNCETELGNQEEVCPNCGSTLDDQTKKAASSDTKEANHPSPSDHQPSESSFTDNEQNETIEWSELKDMSIGHVMDMFTEQQAQAISSDSEEQEELTMEKASIQKEESLADEEALEEKAQELVGDKSALDQYINAHKSQETSSEEAAVADDFIEIDSETEVEVEVEFTEESVLDQTTDILQEDVSSEVTVSNQAESENSVDKESSPLDTVEPTVHQEPLATDETLPIGPKALPKSARDEIPSKSKKPEEIEMDAAPIFFKDQVEDAPAPESRSTFDETKEKNSSDKETLASKQTKNKSKNYKKTVILLASVVVLAGGSWLVYNQMQTSGSSETQTTTSEEQAIKKISDELDKYFTSTNHEFIKPTMVDVSTASIKEKLATLKDAPSYKEVSALYTDVTEKQQTIQQVNALFTQPIINGDQLTDAAIKADQPIELQASSETDGFHKLINQAISQANTQYDQLQKAKAAVAVFYKNDVLTDALTRDTYNTAKTEVDQVKNEALREPLTAVLAKANTALTEAEASQEAAANQAQKDAEAAAAQGTDRTQTAGQTNATTTGQPDANTFSAPNAAGVYTDPVYTAVASDVADVNNPAWVWAPGVKEKVLDTCIARGYITAGAYSLQPARIINGEGYYNLYNAQGQYQVTINAQTGWFKGNASRNAGR